MLQDADKTQYEQYGGSIQPLTLTEQFIYSTWLQHTIQGSQ